MSSKELQELLDCADGIYLKYGATEHVYGEDEEKIEDIERKASLAGLKLIRQRIRHMGTERCAETLRKMRHELDGKVEFKPRTDVKGLVVKNNIVEGIETANGETYSAKYVIAAPGRSGAEWLQTESQVLGLKTLNNPVDVGVRVEVLASVMEELTEVLYEPKLIYYSKSFDDQVRTFCVAPHGEVITESYDGVLTVNGQSYAERKTENTNFAILVSTLQNRSKSR